MIYIAHWLWPSSCIFYEVDDLLLMIRVYILYDLSRDLVKIIISIIYLEACLLSILLSCKFTLFQYFLPLTKIFLLKKHKLCQWNNFSGAYKTMTHLQFPPCHVEESCVVNGNARIEYFASGRIDLTSTREYFPTAPFQSDINIHLFHLFEDYSLRANMCQIKKCVAVWMSKYCISESKNLQ